METNYLVHVSCITYNHSLYIKDAMDGFCMQKTTFPYLCTIIDDASTDGEQEIISKYLHDNFVLSQALGESTIETEDYLLISAQHKTNKNCSFIVLLLKWNHFSEKKPKTSYLREYIKGIKYRAICEGDDYWTKPDKLQKQINILENHEEISICAHNANKLICSNGEIVPFNQNIPSGIYNIKDVIAKKWFTPTASFVYRRKNVISSIWYKNGCNGDMATLYTKLLEGDLYYDSEIMSVYRYGTPSSMSSSSNDRVIVQKKINLYKTINEVTNNKYLLYTTSQIIKLKIMQWQLFRIVNSLRIKVRLKLLGNTK